MSATVAAGLMLSAGACGGGDSDTTGVATLAGASTDSTVAGADQTPEEAALAFAACMRENGMADFADPTVGADGNVEFGAGLGGGQRDNPNFRTAMETCRTKLGTAGFGPGARRGNFDPAAMQEATLAYTQCLRDEGLDVGDLTFGPPPGGTGGAGPGGTGPGGAGPGGAAHAGGSVAGATGGWRHWRGWCNWRCGRGRWPGWCRRRSAGGRAGRGRKPGRFHRRSFGSGPDRSGVDRSE